MLPMKQDQVPVKIEQTPCLPAWGCGQVVHDSNQALESALGVEEWRMY
uniref:Uncharacterized protein n=1 Tax=Anguilla anguilla TaxID=7936 RepID=A0A0E9RG37_ANGAN